MPYSKKKSLHKPFLKQCFFYKANYQFFTKNEFNKFL